MSRHLVAIAGKAGAGKDTVAGILQRLAPHFTITRFAKPLKDAAAVVFKDPENRDLKEQVVTVRTGVVRLGIMQLFLSLDEVVDFDKLWDAAQAVLVPFRKDGAYRISPRQFQQVIGTELREALGLPYLYVNTLSGAKGYNIATDARFPPEVEVADTVVFVYNPNVTSVAEHSSEKLAAELSARYEAGESLGNIIVIVNDGSFDKLEQECRTKLIPALAETFA